MSRRKCRPARIRTTATLVRRPSQLCFDATRCTGPARLRSANSCTNSAFHESGLRMLLPSMQGPSETRQVDHHPDYQYCLVRSFWPHPNQRCCRSNLLPAACISQYVPDQVRLPAQLLGPLSLKKLCLSKAALHSSLVWRAAVIYA